MKHIIFFLLFLATACMYTTAQQSVISGIVSIQNSETFTGKRRYVINAQIEDNNKKATPTITGSNGEFKLVYVGIGEKKQVSFQVKKTGLEVVDPGKLTAIAGQEPVINISMANPDSIIAYRIKLFNIGKTEAEKKMGTELQSKNQQLLLLRKDVLKNANQIKQLQNELDAIHYKIDHQATDLAGKYAQVNLDDASRFFRLAFMHFQKGNTDVALTVLSRMNLPNTVSAIIAQRQKNPDKDSAQNKLAKDACEALVLKATLHKTAFDFDSAAACYKLALQLDPMNETYLSDLADLLPDLGYNQDARINYNKALVIYRRLAIAQPEIYIPKVAGTLNKLGLYAYGWDTDIDNNDPVFDLNKSRAAFLEAIDIYRNLAKQNGKTWLPYLAETLDNLAGRTDNADMDSSMLLAKPFYQEAIAIYKQLAKDDPATFEPAAGKTLISLAGFYRSQFEFTNAAATLQEALAIFRQMAKNKSFIKAEDYTAYCEELAGYIEKDKNQFTEDETAVLETVEKYRQLATTGSAGNLKDLAAALVVLGEVLPKSTARLFIRNNANQNLREALAIYRRLAVTQPAKYLPYIAETFNKLGADYHSNFNSKKEALSYLEAAEIYHQLIKDNPAFYKPLLTIIQEKLQELSINESFFENADDALLQQAIEVFRRLTKYDLAAYGSFVPALQINLAGNYGSHSWFLLMEGSFEAAEKMALKGLQMAPSQIWIKTNLAHALLLQGKYTEAVKVYTVLKTLKNESGESFISICLQDLDALEKKNITTNDVKKIRQFLIE